MYICVYIYIYIHTHVFMNVCIHLSLSMYVCIYIYMYTHVSKPFSGLALVVFLFPRALAHGARRVPSQEDAASALFTARCKNKQTVKQSCQQQINDIQIIKTTNHKQVTNKHMFADRCSAASGRIANVSPACTCLRQCFANTSFPRAQFRAHCSRWL